VTPEKKIILMKGRQVGGSIAMLKLLEKLCEDLMQAVDTSSHGGATFPPVSIKIETEHVGAWSNAITVPRTDFTSADLGKLLGMPKNRAQRRQAAKQARRK